ncbi:MAG: aspartyl protease family protein [Candidatus Thorarchaeota archaeon]|nr:aspartyl protease family protein [Candidatus Thorarchaeota archaeon]
MEVEVKVETGTRLVKVPVKVNGQGPFTFDLDTGASTTTLTPQLAESLGITTRPSDRPEARGIGGGIPTEYADATIGVGSLEFEKDEVYVLDVNAILRELDGRQGVLGYTTLKHCTMSLSYNRQRFKLSRTDSGTTDNDADWSPFEYVNDSHLVGVPVLINGQGPYNFVVDTGAGNTVMTPNLAELLGIEAKAVHGIARGVGGDVELKLAGLETLSVGSAQITNSQVVVLDLSKVSPKGNLIEYGIIGYDFLKNFETILDYPRKQFSFIDELS